MATPREDVRAIFDALYRSSRRRAYSLAYRLTGSAAPAEDLVQDAYVRAWSRFDHYNRDHSFDSWMARILTNLAIDRHRHASVIRILSLDSPLPSGAQEAGFGLPSPDGDPAVTTVDRLALERVCIALDALPEPYRAAIYLCGVKCYSYAEVAARLGCPINTVRSRVHRARSVLRTRLTAMDTPASISSGSTDN